MDKQIREGVIKDVRFGYGGHKNMYIGIKFHLGGESWTAFSEKVVWDANLIPPDGNYTWDERDRDAGNAKVVRYISDLLFKTKVSCINDLVGKSVQAIFIDDKFESWSIIL